MTRKKPFVELSAFIPHSYTYPKTLYIKLIVWLLSLNLTFKNELLAAVINPCKLNNVWDLKNFKLRTKQNRNKDIKVVGSY